MLGTLWRSRRRWGRWVAATVVAAGGVACLALLAVAGARARLEAPGATLLLRDRNGQHLGEVPDTSGAELGYWPLAELPPRVVAATIALEDRRFGLHPGVDPLAVARAFAQNLRSGRRVSGASTLAMQVARMQRPGPRTLPHKLVEAATAWLLTARYGRGAILAHYLRLAPYGNRVRGIGFAARRYFDKPVEDLSWAEIAFLAAIPQAPSRMNPYTYESRHRAAERGARLLDLLAERGVITTQEHALAVVQIARLAPPPRPRRPRETMHAVLRLAAELGTPEARAALASPLVRTTLDLDLQCTLDETVERGVDAWEGHGAANAAVVVIELGSREVLAYVASSGYFDDARRGAIDYARVERSPGSTLKPFLYALALERGVITPASVLDDLRRGPGGITNADERFLGPLLPRVALANSRNVPAVEVLARTGSERALALLRELGLHDGAEPSRHYGLGLAVGGMPVTLERLVRAYLALAAGGRYGELVWRRGAPVGTTRRVIDENAARAVTLFLADPLARLPSFPRMGPLEYPFPVAVKTGTSPEMRDAWAVAWSARYLVGAWVGRHDWRPMEGVSGYGTAAWLARASLLTLHRELSDGLHDLSFPPPRGARLVALCGLTGARATEACDRTIAEWLLPAQEPAALCTAHVLQAVDRRTGRPAGVATPARFRERRAFVALPERYAAWAARSGLPQLLDGPRAISSALDRDRVSRIRITAPRNGTRLLRDPEAPLSLATLGLEAVVEPAADSLLWLVDGRPFLVADHPYVARWPLTRGEHVFQARVPFTSAVSPPVRVLVE